MTFQTPSSDTSSRDSTDNSHNQPLLDAAQQFTQSGISVVPTDSNKIPVGGKWGHLKQRRATPDELTRMFSHPKAQGIALIGGAVSGNLFTLDFEGKNHAHNPMPSVYPMWEKMAKEALAQHRMADLFDTIPVIKTQNHGYHTHWQVEGDGKLPNEKLAKQWALNSETGEPLTDKNGKPIADLLIESKGEGGCTICPPTPGYELIGGDLTHIPILPIGVHEILVGITKSFHTAIEEKSRVTSSAHESNCTHEENANTIDSDNLKPGDDYNQRGDWRRLIQAEGWELVREQEGIEYWKRPGTTHLWSATFSHQYNTFYVFSDNATPFEAESAYSPFAIYTLINHDGNFNAAAKDLAAQEFGSQNRSKGNGHNGASGRNGNSRPFRANAEPGRNGSGNGNETSPPHGATQENVGQGAYQTFDNAAADATNTFDIRPPVIVNNRQMRHVIADMQTIIRESDQEPLIYQKDGRLVRITFNKERATLDYFAHDTLGFTLNEYADFLKARETKEGVKLTPTPPPVYLAKGILHAPRHEVPELSFISGSPLFAPDGSLAKKQGYNEQVKAYLHLADDLEITDTDLDPTPENVSTSKALIAEMVAEFPFESDASRHNAISLLLLPFLRSLIDAEIPLYACDSSDPGTGKGLLIDSLLTPYLSHRPISNSEISGDEWRKQLTTLLEYNPDVIYFDNANKIDSAALASALTKGYWQDRRLGKNELSTSEIRAIFVVNGNNLEISGEIARRVVWIRMVANTEDPEERAFQISDLRQWVSDHRRQLVIAALTLINNWVQAGMPKGNLRMGSFSRWAAVISGVMEANGYDQFMTNLPQLKSRVDVTRDAMREFVTAWYNESQTQTVNAAQLLRLASIEYDENLTQEVGQGILSELLTSNTRRGRANQLRNILRKNTDRTFRLVGSEPDAFAIQCKIESVNKRQNGYMVYKLTEIRPESEPPHDLDEVHLRFTERFTEEPPNDSAGFNDSSEPSEPQGENLGKTENSQKESKTVDRNTHDDEAVEDTRRNTHVSGKEQRDEEGEPKTCETVRKQKGSLGCLRFTDVAPKVHPDRVCTQVNLKVNLTSTGSLETEPERGSLQNNKAAADEKARAYVRSRIQTQADLYRQGKCEALSPYQIGLIRSEANQKFGTDFVTDDIEALWEALVKTAATN